MSAPRSQAIVPAPAFQPRVCLRPPASLGAVLRGRAPLVGPRCDDAGPAGFVSPIEARVHLGIPYGDLAVEERASLAQRDPRKDLALVLRCLLARFLAPRAPSSRTVARPRIVSARVDNLSIAAALAKLLEPSCGPRARMVHFVHPHALNIAATDAALAQRLRAADLVLPDGVGLRIAARILGVSLTHNINGTDLLPLLCREAAAKGVPLALVGAAPGVAEACAARLRAEHPGLEIAVVQHGFVDAEGSAAVAARIERLGRAIVLVGMGSPRQEAWAWRHLSKIRGATVITVGGLFDFYSGRVPRAPMAWRELGLEWLWRLRVEPRRLARRYLVGNPRFVARALLQRASGAPAAA